MVITKIVCIPTGISSALKKKKQVKSPIYIVSLPGLGSDSPIGSNRESGSDTKEVLDVAKEALDTTKEVLAAIDACRKNVAPGHYLQLRISDKDLDDEIMELIYSNYGGNKCC